MADELLKTHVFCFNEEDNGGESLTLTTYFFNGEPDGIYIGQDLSLQSYGRNVTINIAGDFTPENLRKLADELEEELKPKTLEVNYGRDSRL